VTAEIVEPKLELPRDFWHAPSVLVAVSGGSDSMALLHALLRHRHRLEARQPVPHVLAFHFDHRWQEGSGDVARSVEAKLNSLGLRTHIRSRALPGFSSPDQKTETGSAQPQSEGIARSDRYAAMAEVAESTGATFALTGHTRDDQSETILMRIARGTGLAGLAGIPRQRPLTANCQLLRPFLQESRQRLRTYLQDLGQDYWDDPTNDDSNWTRNRVRQVVLPWLRQNLSPQFDESLVRLGQLASEHQEVVRCLAEQHRGAILECRDQLLVIDVRPLAELPEGVLRTMLVHWWSQAKFPQQEMDREHWGRLAALICRPVDGNAASRWPSEWHFPGPIIAKRSAGVLRIVTPMK
jgi:tRNA(Ile)-lysidine synthase